MLKIWRSWASASGCAVLGTTLVVLTGCGGGGGGNDDPSSGGVLPPVTPPASAPASTDHTLATISTDIYPSGARVDVSAKNFMPLHVGDKATFVKYVAGAASATSSATREVVAPTGGGSDVLVKETAGTSTTTQRFQVTSEGLAFLDPLSAQGSLPGLYDAFTSVVLLPAPFYPAGSTTYHVRQGALNADIDGDAKSDYFSLTYSQTFVGFESMTVFGVSTEVAHFRIDADYYTQSVATGAQKRFNRKEEVWLSSGLGPVRIERSETIDGVTSPLQSLEIQTATIDGIEYGGTAPSGANAAIALVHEFLVYDPTRRVYYASMSATSSQSNRIATISAATGAVSYSAPVGSSPAAMAVSSDGASLWVALDGSGDVVRLLLPSMTEAARVRLPKLGGDQSFAEELSSSPTSANTVAVALYVKTSSPRYAGAGLIRADVLQPTLSQNFDGSNTIAFDPNGTYLYGYNNETSEFGLHRFDVLANGVVQQEIVLTDAGYWARLRVGDGLITISSRVYRTGAVPSLLGTVAAASDCVKLPNVAKIACHTDDLNDPTKLVIVDSTTFALVGSPAFSLTASLVFYGRWRLVPGLAGQIAISEPDRVVLFSDPILR